VVEVPYLAPVGFDLYPTGAANGVLPESPRVARPWGPSLDEVKAIRDDIARRVNALVLELDQQGDAKSHDP
jgi:hypothetical protein